MAPEDVADAVASVLRAAVGGEGSPHDGTTYRLTGPEAFTLAVAAATLGAVVGREIHADYLTAHPDSWDHLRPAGA